MRARARPRPRSPDPNAWPAFPRHTALARCDVHVVRIDLVPPDLGRELPLLSSDEQSRASRLHFEVDRRRWIAARAALRRVLADYVGVDASSLAFSYSPRGRPSLKSPRSAPDFNLAHSEDLALLALSRGPVGIDVEKLRSVAEANQIADEFFCARELASLERLPPALRVRGFLCAWTRKEALLKATGLGVTALREVEVSLEPDRRPVVLSAPDGVSGWRLFHLDPTPEFVGALAVSGSARRLRCWQWHWL